MTTIPKLTRTFSAVLFLCACNASGRTPSAAPAQQDKKEQKGSALEDWKPAILPADALAYGAALYQQAPPKIKAWCEEFARKEMPKRRIDPRETMAVVDQQFPHNSNEARDAAIYLVFYLSYLDEDFRQRALAGEIRRLDDEAREMILHVRDMQEAENNRLARRIPSQQEMMRNQEELQRTEQKLQEMSDTRKQRMKELLTARKRTDGYLKVLDVTHKRMNGIGPSILREFP